jgi:hypothetical protein
MNDQEARQIRFEEFIKDELVELHKAQLWQQIAIGLLIVVNFLYAILN